MAEAVQFADGEELAVDWLAAQFAARGDTVSVSTKVPRSRPDRFIRVQRVGGARLNLIEQAPLLLFECWDATEPDASELARRAHAFMGAVEDEIVGGVLVAQARPDGGPVLNPDPDTLLPRYTFTTELVIEGSVI